LSLIKVTHLSKTYMKGRLEIPALRDVSFEVGEGDFVSIVGRSGSGKSTLLNLLGGLDTPTSGQIFFKDSDLAGMSRSDLALHRRYTVGMVFQSFNLITHRTALENVALALTFGGVTRAERRGRASDLLSEVGLGERLAHRPSELSGGEAQRVAIARALANRPEVLLLDEPTGNLDTSTSSEIIDLVKGLNRDRGLTAIMVTHEHDIAESVSSRIIRLLDGTVDAVSGQGAGQ
jgi:putative ABC transport system ATP-binding protein